MKAEEIDHFKFAQPGKPTQNAVIQCPGCSEWIPIEEWKPVEIGCDLCGSHDGILCPKCDDCFDQVRDVFNFKNL